MKNITTFQGVGVAGMSWTLRVSGTASPAAYPASIARDAIAQRKRHAAAANVASVNRGTT
jgi:phage terminase large subunit-like protein